MLTRLHAAVEVASSTHVQQQEEGEGEVVLPYDVVRDYLVDHPLVSHAILEPRAVHRALVALHGRLGAPQQAPQPPPVRPRCPHCGVGREVLDAHEGWYVCDDCGVVLSGSVNVTPEFQAAPQLKASCARARCVPGVPWTLLMPPKERSYREELAHWNTYAHVGTDDLAYLDRVLCAWTDGCHPRLVRVVAALLYDRIRPQFAAAAATRARLRKRKALETVDDPTPAPRFACATCARACHTARDARFHCKAWGVKRARL